MPQYRNLIREAKSIGEGLKAKGEILGEYSKAYGDKGDSSSRSDSASSPGLYKIDRLPRRKAQKRSFTRQNRKRGGLK